MAVSNVYAVVLLVAAGSMVTKDVLPYTLVAGNPAVVVRQLESKR